MNSTPPSQIPNDSQGSSSSLPGGSHVSAIRTAPNDRGGGHGDGTQSQPGRTQHTQPHQMRPPAHHTPITRHTTAFPLNKKKRTNANLKIATLNIRGQNASTGTGSNNKWRDLNQLLRDTRTGIIALQETHLTEESVNEIHNLFGLRMKVIFSQGDNPRAAGVVLPQS
jgi:hypothetical protein